MQFSNAINMPRFPSHGRGRRFNQGGRYASLLRHMGVRKERWRKTKPPPGQARTLLGETAQLRRLKD